MGNTGVAVLLQVRLSSTRLPEKALLDLEGQTVIEHAMDSLSQVSADHRALVTDQQSASVLRPLAAGKGWEIFQGHPSDVLKRYADALRFFGCRRFIRATGDNPLVFSGAANAILGAHILRDADYSGYNGLPYGAGVEVVEADALFAAEEEAEDPYEREHVTPFLYRNPHRFFIHRPDAPRVYRLPEARITLDTSEDYLFLQRLFADLYKGRPLAAEELIPWLEKELIGA